MRGLAAALLAVPLVCAAQAVPRPDVKVGDSWTYRRMNYDANRPGDIFTMSVVFAERGVIQAVSLYGKKKGEVDTTYTADWNPVSSASRVFNPHTGWFRFPLRVGDTYKASYEAIEPRTKGSWRAEREVKVVGWEEVVVPAGNFRALKIVSEGQYRRTDVFGSGTSRIVIWYVPEIKRWAKRTGESRPTSAGAKGKGEYTGEELVDYRLQ
jgi:hypothetical protein